MDDGGATVGAHAERGESDGFIRLGYTSTSDEVLFSLQCTTVATFGVCISFFWIHVVYFRG
jgi:hypothetical protein